jgi:hypothetical protein
VWLCILRVYSIGFKVRRFQSGTHASPFVVQGPGDRSCVSCASIAYILHKDSACAIMCCVVLCCVVLCCVVCVCVYTRLLWTC